MAGLTGEQFVAGRRVAGTGAAYRGTDPRSGVVLEPAYTVGTGADVDAAADAAARAFRSYRRTTPAERADFLERIAVEIESVADELVPRYIAESGLPEGRARGELARTTGQLRLFAGVVREGSWVAPRLEPAQPERTPVPRPDLRQRRVPLGPVAVFGASNFPLAFSVAGGDTASALAAGCPVVVKAHPSHPGVSEIVAGAVTRAVAASGLDAGVFSMVQVGIDDAIGLVTHPAIKGVGFTGSRGAGLALLAAGQNRPVPIPVYAEMSSTNPVFLLPGALAERAEEIAAGFVGSLTLGSGQFCTNPGTVFAVDSPELDTFVAAASAAIARSSATPMLNAGIGAAYADGVARLGDVDGVERLALGRIDDEVATSGVPQIFGTDLGTFAGQSTTQDEIFGAASLVVRVRDERALVEAVAGLEGQLTATVHTADGDLELAAELTGELELVAGRVLFNGWPTGVDVGHAMVHGGPFPATSDGRSTSVGSLAIDRWVRPVAYQDAPAGLLPPELADDNPWQLWREVDGEPGRH